MPLSQINLELYWTGAYTYKNNGNISAIDLKMKNCSYEVTADINTNLSATENQRLVFSVGLQWKKTFSTLEWPADLDKSMLLSARILKPLYKTVSVSVLQSDGTYSPQLMQLYNQIDLPIFFEAFLAFKANETYQIKIANEKNTLTAAIEKKRMSNL